MTHRSVETGVLARVEGGGGLHVRVEDGHVADVRLEIFEPPRYFEGLLTGRPYADVMDIVPRICGICPVAYQMTAAHALEALFGCTVPEGTRELRRLFYCGEWIQSHMLHVHLLAAPDFLGHPHALALAAADRPAFDRGLRLRGVGSEIMSVIGGRPVHPVSPAVGGFSRVPSVAQLRALRPGLEQAAAEILEVADWVAGFEFPSVARPVEMVALVHPDEYPMNEGRLATSSGTVVGPDRFEELTEQLEVAHSTAYHSRLVDGRAFFVGPLARLNLNAGHLTPLAAEAARRLSLELPEPDPFRSIAARVVETALAIDEAIRLIDAYSPPVPARAAVVPRAGRATWATEAPRGVLYHRYDVDSDGIIRSARLVPPTSQNLSKMEEDVRLVATSNLHLTDADVTRLCEMAVRNYDPCISCATHLVRFERR